MGIPCSVAGIEYKFIGSATMKLGISYNEMKRRLASFDYPDYVCDKIPKKPSIPSRRKKYPCIIDEIHYESEYAAVRALGVSINTVRSRLRSSNFPEYISKHHPKIKRRKRIASTSCIIKMVEYTSVANAARKLKISAPTIFKRLASFDYPDYVCTEIPKAPERPKPIKYGYVVNGKKYRTLQEIGDMEGVTRERIRQKMNDSRKPEYQKL